MFARLEKYGNIGTREPDMLNGKHVYDSFSFYDVENRFANCLSYLRFFKRSLTELMKNIVKVNVNFFFWHTYCDVLKRKVDEATWK